MASWIRTCYLRFIGPMIYRYASQECLLVLLKYKLLQQNVGVVVRVGYDLCMMYYHFCNLYLHYSEADN